MSVSLTEVERAQAAAALEEIVDAVAGGALGASVGQLAYIAGAAAGLRGELDRLA